MASRLSLLVAIAFAQVSWAHDADVISVVLEPSEARPRAGLRETVTLTASALGQLAPVDADGDGLLTQADLDARSEALAAGVWGDMPLSSTALCLRNAVQATVREGFVELQADFLCNSGELHQDFRWLRVLPANFKVIVTSGPSRSYAQGSLTSVSLPWPSAAAATAAKANPADGFARAFTLASLCTLAALGVAFRRWGWAARSLAFFLAALALAALASAAFVVPQVLAWLLFAAASVMLAWVRREAPWWVTVCGGIAGGVISPGVEAVGFAVMAVPVLVAFTALGRLLWRRNLGATVSWALAAVACFAAGLRLFA